MNTVLLHKIYIPAIVVAAVISFLLLRGWVLEREQRIRAEEHDKQAESIIATKDHALAERDRQWQEQKADLQRQIESIKTAAQAKQVLQPILLQSGTGPGPQVSKSDLPAAVQSTLPGAPDAKVTLLTDAQLIDLARREKACQGIAADLGKCTSDIADWRAKYEASQDNVKSLKKTVKGGTWVQRTFRVVVPVACAAGGAWLGSSQGGKNGAAVGALAGGGICALSFHF